MVKFTIKSYPMNNFSAISMLLIKIFRDFEMKFIRHKRHKYRDLRGKILAFTFYRAKNFYT